MFRKSKHRARKSKHRARKSKHRARRDEQYENIHWNATCYKITTDYQNFGLHDNTWANV